MTNRPIFRARRLATLMVILFSFSLFAQAQSVLEHCSVKVTDSNGEPLPGVAVSVQGTGKGENTDINGVCSFSNLPSNAVLEFFFLGMDPLKEPVSGRKSISVRMHESAIMMDEVVVVGYGTMRKKDLSGAVAQVKGDVINEYSTLSVANALQGRVSGVEITQTNGQPGAGMQVRIRGANSIKGSNDPLWIIDGFPGDINMINNADIESVEILKDASATAIYGSRGANGVVIVTTKRAKEGKLKVEYNGSVGVQTITKKLDVLNASEYMDYLNQLCSAQGRSPLYTAKDIETNVYNVDWQEEVLRPAVTTDHAVSVSGGTKKLQSSIGASYFKQDGIVINSGYQRVSLRTNLNYDISKYFSVNGGIIFSRADHDRMQSQGMDSVIHTLLVTPPISTPYYDDGTYNDFVTSPTGGTNPVAYQKEISNKWYSNRAALNAGLTIRPLDGLSIQFSANVLSKDARSDYFKTLNYPNSKGAASISFSENLDFTSNNVITYDKGFGKHHINAMAGMTYESSVSKSTSTGTAEGFLSDVVETYDINMADIKGLPSSGYSDWRLISFLGRLNYNYDNRYLLTVNFRSDGSSRYSRGNKWGYFPSAAVAWRISQEDFMRDVRGVDELKLRLGYGVTGSTAISPYSTQNTLETGNVVFDKTTTVSYAPKSAYLGDLRWESTAQWNAGLDASFFKKRLSFTLDAYDKKTYDLLNDVEMPGSSGYTTALKNIGSIRNRGIELQVDSRPVDGSFKWDLGLNFSMNRSKILSLADHADIFGSKVSCTLFGDQLNIMREGEQMYLFYGYVEKGYDDKGNIEYVDLDDDGAITALDKKVIGNPNPDFLLNLNTSFHYKGFSLSAFFQGSFGNDIYSLSMGNICYNYGKNTNTLRDVYNNHWTPENPNAKYPALLSNVNLKMSDRFVYDGTYVRLKNLELAYSFDCSKSKALSGAKVYVSGQNLFTFTSYPMWNPDVNAYGGGSSLRQGVDLYCYPVAMTFTLGCRLAF